MAILICVLCGLWVVFLIAMAAVGFWERTDGYWRGKP